MKHADLAGWQASRIGLGAWAIGGQWEYGWGPQDADVSLATLHRAVELGVNWIDTAAVYGLGRSEQIVGRFLAETDARPLVFTKGGIPWDASGAPDHVLKHDSLLREFDASCARLGVERVDLYQIHWPIPDADVEEAVATLEELRADGRIAKLGVSNFSAEQMERARAVAAVDVLQGPFSLIDRSVSAEILPYCGRNAIPFINYSPMASGLLTGKVTRAWLDALPADDWRRTKSDLFREPKLAENLAIAERVVQLAEQRGVFPGALAVAWTLHHPAVTASIVGARRPDQLDDLIAAADIELTGADLAFLEGRADAELPAAAVGD